MGDVGDDAVIIVGIAQYTLLFEAIDERGAIIVGKSLCCFCRYCVGIGIQDIAFSVMSQRSDDGSNAIFDEIGKNLTISFVNVAYKAVVDSLSGML